ncbi:hypothetical protein [Halobellus inordinatus]|uniref:hypothetical protein n=1 Tax=Halobellus inordinatus TaxID=1126236 RepID=UPI0021149203|nr:hypothetical protein [Halobellus ramosii]
MPEETESTVPPVTSKALVSSVLLLSSILSDRVTLIASTVPSLLTSAVDALEISGGVLSISRRPTDVLSAWVVPSVRVAFSAAETV